MLSIRTQDRMALVPYNRPLEVSKLLKHDICIKNGNNDYTMLGTYKSKARALEVLDEIEDMLYQASDVNLVYQMPKE